MCRSAAVAFDVDQRDGLYEDVLLPCNAGGQGGGGIMNPRAAEGWGRERRREGRQATTGIPRQMNRLENGIVKVRECTDICSAMQI